MQSVREGYRLRRPQKGKTNVQRMRGEGWDKVRGDNETKAAPTEGRGCCSSLRRTRTTRSAHLCWGGMTERTGRLTRLDAALLCIVISRAPSAAHHPLAPDAEWKL